MRYCTEKYHKSAKQQGNKCDLFAKCIELCCDMTSRVAKTICAPIDFLQRAATLNWVGGQGLIALKWKLIVKERTSLKSDPLHWNPLISEVPKFVSRHFIWFFCMCQGVNYPAFKCENIPCKMQQIGLPEASRWTQINEYSLRSHRILSCIKRVCFVCRSHMRRGLVHFKAALSFALPLYSNCDLLLAVATVVAHESLRK